jgi:hypothetical protein
MPAINATCGDQSQASAGILSDTYHDGAHYEKKLALCCGYFRVMRTRRAGPPFIRIGRSIRYSERAMAEWLAGQQGGAA